jgi:hypothetical protein
MLCKKQQHQQEQQQQQQQQQQQFPYTFTRSEITFSQVDSFAKREDI